MVYILLIIGWIIIFIFNLSLCNAAKKEEEFYISLRNKRLNDYMD
ncbi:hypothetical protein [Clostridium fallax]|uniref:Uncharacterized protein n=1 Tax=Clostridium fallax TaxID=1533 RepID=A0A1M4VPU6_9CLOT|nr:hypothetical protein [Clostridium fallax]SHE70867.1 hypothetical protein SAMN05443638_10882 [Clostridium fallax]SQB22823.1 Uncharacterised protein [Clostridium fallax]